ncbi:hypothetical protein COCOBI_09-5810 [Coccomyxa sp. Obi]|nr:hypothetical protein COCOBI_09-5810 [Coccomyxa sp. Obi]
MVALGGSITCGSITHDVPSYIEQVFQWINATFPHPENTFINSCKGGSGSTETALCFDAKVPRNADLITMEFTLNDAYSHVPYAVEHNIHNPLAWPRDMHSDRRHAPKFSSFRTWRGFEVLLRSALVHPNEPALVYIHAWVPPFEGFSWWMSQEADMSAFLEYYRYYADVMVAFLQDHAWAAATGPLSGPPTGPRSPLPAPLIPNNYEHGQQCAINEALITLVESSQGWEWVDQGKSGCGVLHGWEWVDEGKLGHHKRGWRSVTPGSKLITKPMDTTSKVQPSKEPVLLILGILKSYQHMGQAVLACESGCTCKPLEFNAHHTNKESVYHLVSQSPACVVSITVLQATSSSEHKIRIDMLGISTTGNATVWVRDHSHRPSASRKSRKLHQS